MYINSANNMINVLIAVALQRGLLQMLIQAGEVISVRISLSVQSKHLLNLLHSA